MALCPFATHKLVGGAGPMVGGAVPWRIVHHTTEGPTLAGAEATLHAKHVEPHFTVSATAIEQMIDTDQAAKALRHPGGTLETNRENAIQIEVVGFAGKPKDPATLANVAKLCRWLEAQHAIPQAWPNGFPKPPHNGQDPGGHNRNAHNWATMGGHYGHCHIPNNTHWDPAYTAAEVAIVTPGAAAPAVSPGDSGMHD